MSGGPPSTSGWHTIESAQMLREVDSSRDGLIGSEAAERLVRNGPNTLATGTIDPWWRILFRQFASVIIVVLIISTGLTALLGRWIDAAAILIAVLVDVVLGFVQELRASRAVAALRKLDVRTCHVRRSGMVTRVPVETIVVGDIVVLESGDRIPADLRWVSVNGLRVDESLLTGESIPVDKGVGTTPASTPLAERLGMGWSGTLVVAGRAEGVVLATGASTMVGEIDTLVRTTDTPTPLQRIMHRFESQVGIVVAIVAVAVLAGGLLTGAGFAESFLTAVSLAVAAIPEGLPVILTIALSLGVGRMARKRAVVRTLPAVEALGSTTVIATDKTGTLTANRMTVERVWSPDVGALSTRGEAQQLPTESHLVLRTGGLTNDAHHNSETGALLGDPVDLAIARLALESAALTAEEFGQDPICHVAYEPVARCSATVRLQGEERILLVKGAADLLLDRASVMHSSRGNLPIDRRLIQAAHDDMARSGLRVLAVARRRLATNEEPDHATTRLHDLEFVGLLGMTDPPREGVSEAIAACRRAGIMVVMITGDHPATATAIGDRIAIGGAEPPVTGTELEQLDDEQLVARVRAARIAARVTPTDKLRIVRALEAAGEVVAVTGDGVNDAPALKAASLGVAMGRGGTDVARAAADIVLLDDAFSTIVAAVKEGRVTFAAAQKATFFLISTGAAALLVVGGNMLLGGILIFLPAQLIWFNLVSNGAQDVGLAFEPGEGDELERRPRSPASGLLGRTLWIRVALTAVWMAAAVLAAFHVSLAWGAPLAEARTMALTVFAFLNLFQTFSSRSEHQSVFRQGVLGNRLLLCGALGSILVHVLAVETAFGWTLLDFTPLTWQQWVAAAAAGATVLAVAELDKLRVRRTAVGSSSLGHGRED